MTVSYKANPSGKGCYCQVFSEGTADKGGENLSLPSGPASDHGPWQPFYEQRPGGSERGPLSLCFLSLFQDYLAYSFSS